ncbi:MAG TPA: V-type ATPase subunit, partial [bacterium]|nr:V-type ATPase subunit [bacterium]
VVAYLEKYPVVGDIIRPAYERYLKNKNLYVLDSAIDIGYLSNLYRSIQEINPFDRERLKRLYGTQMDLNNLLWALRLKFIYGVEPGEILADLVPEYYEYTEKFFKSIVYETDIKNVFAILLKLPWTKYVSQEAVTIGDIERGFALYLKDMAFGMFKKDKFSLSVIVGFLFMKRAEIAYLVKLLEAKEYGVSSEDLERILKK